MGSTVVAWESHNWFWNDLGHSLGAFVTSAGFAGSAAVIAAVIAACQVSGTRSDDRAAVAAVNAAKRRDQLWARFEWIASNRRDLGMGTSSRMLVAVEKEAKAAGDTNLVVMVSTLRLRTVAQTPMGPS